MLPRPPTLPAEHSRQPASGVDWRLCHSYERCYWLKYPESLMWTVEGRVCPCCVAPKSFGQMTLRVRSHWATSRENLPMTAMFWKRTSSGPQGKLVLLCNRGVRPCKTMTIPSYRHSGGYPGIKES